MAGADHQLIREQRYQIAALKSGGLTQTRGAEVVGAHKSTISREPPLETGTRA